MKKVLFIVVCLFAFSGVKAQFFVGGNFDVGYNSLYKSSQTDFGISAKLGYIYKPHFRFGLSFGYDMLSDVKHQEIIGFNVKSRSTRYNIYPFVQYRIFEYDRFKVFAEASFGYHKELSEATVGSISSVGINNNGFGFVLRPVATYSVNECIRITAALNILRLDFDYVLGQKTNGSEDSMSFRFGGGSSIGSLGIGYVF